MCPSQLPSLLSNYIVSSKEKLIIQKTALRLIKRNCLVSYIFLYFFPLICIAISWCVYTHTIYVLIYKHASLNKTSQHWFFSPSCTEHGPSTQTFNISKQAHWWSSQHCANSKQLLGIIYSSCCPSHGKIDKGTSYYVRQTVPGK